MPLLFASPVKVVRYRTGSRLLKSFRVLEDHIHTQPLFRLVYYIRYTLFSDRLLICYQIGTACHIDILTIQFLSIRSRDRTVSVSSQ